MKWFQIWLENEKKDWSIAWFDGRQDYCRLSLKQIETFQQPFCPKNQDDDVAGSFSFLSVFMYLYESYLSCSLFCEIKVEIWHNLYISGGYILRLSFNIGLGNERLWYWRWATKSVLNIAAYFCVVMFPWNDFWKNTIELVFHNEYIVFKMTRMGLGYLKNLVLWFRNTE